MNSTESVIAPLTYRLLSADEWPRLNTLVEAPYLPAPDSAACAVAEDAQGQIVGVLFFQLQIHMEPLLIRHPSVSFLRLADELHEAVAEQKGLVYFAFTDSPKIARMAELAGFEPMPYQVWRKEVV